MKIVTESKIEGFMKASVDGALAIYFYGSDYCSPYILFPLFYEYYHSEDQSTEESFGLVLPTGVFFIFIS